MFYPIGLRQENLFASGEPFCVGYLLSRWLGLVWLAGMDPCPQAPNKRPHTQNASLCSMRLDRRTDREQGCVRVYAFFFAHVGLPSDKELLNCPPKEDFFFPLKRSDIPNLERFSHFIDLGVLGEG